MLWFLRKCIQQFGFWDGLQVWLQLKVLRKEAISLPDYAGPVYLRPGTADLTTFREIFLREEYNLTLPASFHPRVIIDAGANIGFTSLFFAHQYPEVIIYSLEPEPDNFTLLRKNAAAYPTIKPIHAAVWHRDGVLKVTDQGYGLRGFMVEETAEAAEAIPAITIPMLIKQHRIGIIDILKMDIEGSEKEVFSGDTSWLATTRCLVIELHDRMKPGCSDSVFGALRNFNFSESRKGENHVFINRDLVGK